MSAVGSAIKIAIMLAATDRATPIIGKVFNNAERHAKRLVETQENLNKIGDQALIAGVAMSAFFKKSVDNARENDIAQQKLIQGFKTMGANAKLANAAIEFSDKLQYKINIDDSQIMDVQGELATFARLWGKSAQSSDLFNRATQAAFDSAAKYGVSAMSVAIQLGKAFQNPALGAAALSRTGAINKEDIPLIAQMQKIKGVAATQAYMMKLIEKQVKGTAAASVDPIKQIGFAWDKITETVGHALLPTVNKLADWIIKYIPKIKDFVDHHKTLIKYVAIAGVSLIGLGAAFKIAAFALNPLIWGFKIFGTVQKFLKTAEIIKNLTMLKGTFLQVGQFAGMAFDAIKTGVVNGVKFIGQGLASVGSFLAANPIVLIIAGIVAAALLIYKYWSPIKNFFIKLWNGILNNKYVQMALAVFMPIIGIPIIIIKHWNKIKSFFADLWDKVKKIFMVWVDWTFGLPVRMFKVGVAFVSNIWNGIKSKATWLLDKVKGVVQKIRNFFPFSPAKEGPLKDIHKVKLMETIATTIRPQPIVSALNRALRPIGATHTGGLHSYGNNNNSVVFAPVIHLHGGATKRDAQMINKSMESQFNTLMKRYQAQQSRLNFH